MIFIIMLNTCFCNKSRYSDNANQRIYCQLLAVSGSGGGGGGTTYSNRSKIYKEDPESNYSIYGRSSSIRVYALSGKDPEDGSQLDTRLIVHWTLAEKTSALAKEI